MGIISTINSFIPFADPSRPVWIDIVYSLILCTILWLGPQLQTFLNKVTQQAEQPAAETLQQDNTVQDLDQQPIVGGQAENEPFARGQGPHEDSESDDDQAGNEFELDDPADLAAFQQFLDEQPGPANPPPQPQREPQQLQPPAQPARLRDPNRPVGAKKARSLARRQQIRAYHEFVREQSDQQRALDASTREEREASQAAERKRREEVEARIRENEEAIREAKRAKEKKEREEEMRMVKVARNHVGNQLDTYGIFKLSDAVKDLRCNEEWLLRVLRTESILGAKSSGGKQYLVMVTGSGYVVKISDDEMKDFFIQLSKGDDSTKHTQGVKASSEELGFILSSVLLKKRSMAEAKSQA